MRRTAMVVLLAAWAAGCGERLVVQRGAVVEPPIPRAAGWQAPATKPVRSPLALEHDDPSPVDHLARVRVLEESGDLAGALAEARRAAYDRPDELAPAREVARLARLSGDRTRERLALVALAKHQPTDARPPLRLARLLLEEGDAGGTLLEATVALNRDPELAEAYHLRGRAELRLGMREEAIRDFESAVILEPRHAHAFNNLGYALLLCGDPEAAIAPLERAAELAPHLAYVRNNLGLALERAGLLDQAREQFDAALALSPRHARAVVNLERVVEAIGSGEVLDLPEAPSRDTEPSECAHNPLHLETRTASTRGLLLGRRAAAEVPECD
ncbi:MAG: tetratricopeptide repeat protein [Myxococcales bacterium]|jgi:Flp pilus assembly protein TadD